MRKLAMAFIALQTVVPARLAQCAGSEPSDHLTHEAILQYVLDEIERSRLAIDNVHLEATWENFEGGKLTQRMHQALFCDRLGRIRIEMQNDNLRDSENFPKSDSHPQLQDAVYRRRRPKVCRCCSPKCEPGQESPFRQRRVEKP